MVDKEVFISIRDLTFRQDDALLLSVPNLDVSGDGITAIMGPNGAGKSVFLRLMHGIIQPSSGAITFPKHPKGPRQAMVFQKPVLLRRTVASNVRFALSAAGEQSGIERDLLLHCGLEDKANQPARSLSGGEQQRLAMARALATRPEILFLDEPTANLDPSSTKVIEDLIADTNKKAAKVVVVTHDIAQARRLAETVIFCHDGQVVESGRASERLSSPETRQARDFLEGRISV